MIYIDDSEPEGELEPAFPYRDVTIQRGVDANELYEILGEVGRGKFGTVYKCQDKSNSLKLAAKFVPIPKREDRRNVEREVEIMNSLQHHLIIQLYAAYEYQKMMCVVQELVEGGELFDRVVDDEFVLTERVCVVFIRQVCEAMEFIHRNNILHLDLKPENILCLTQEGNRIKIIDFGLARKFDPDKKLQILFGTPEFVAPEVVNFDSISYATDMWSVGVITYVLISGLSPFMGETDIETMANVTIAKYDFEDESFANVSPEGIDFISKLLVKDLSTRMTAAQCMKHKWLQRRPKSPPKVAPKPLNIPAAQLKASTPSPIPPNIDNDDSSGSLTHDEEDEELSGTKELDTTKDNLKNFIERWEEHPNSPYVFDVEGNVIAPLSETEYKQPHEADSISSSRVCSPSPCESLGTITDEESAHFTEIEEEEEPPTPINESREKLFPSSSGSATPTPQNLSFGYPFASKLDEFNGSSMNLQQRSLKSYLHTFDRRNSDTNYLLGRRSSGERVNLADEIKKLSDHLLMLAEINTKFSKDGKQQGEEAEGQDKEEKKAKKPKETGAEKKSSTKTSTSSKTKDSSGESKSAKVSSKTSSTSTSSSKTSENSMTTSTTITSSSSTSSSATTTSSFFSNLNPGKSRTSTLSWRLQQSIEETPKLNTNSWSNKSVEASSSTTTTKKSSVSTISTGNAKTSNEHKFNEAASIRRAKFRINQMSRDVPIGLPDTHQTVNLEEAANNTKDCLLHLLEKYNDTKTRNPLGRHQSISVDCNVRDNLEYRSMSSINAFFQRHNNNGDMVKQLQAQLKEKTGDS
ncbi:death-associated protein kinase related [Calliphora vicina]|uniref:death-associated protein kinase related n=1 Tax=Calliphora vicina TaxID=7373 RepID=UPI00325AF3E6